MLLLVWVWLSYWEHEVSACSFAYDKPEGLANTATDLRLFCTFVEMRRLGYVFLRLGICKSLAALEKALVHHLIQAGLSFDQVRRVTHPRDVHSWFPSSRCQLRSKDRFNINSIMITVASHNIAY